MTLAEKLETLTQQAAKDSPEEVTHAFGNAIGAWLAVGIDKHALKPGDRVPSFQLEDASGNQVVLDEVLKRGPVVISFFRGGWCPWCSLELRELQANLDNMKLQGATLLAISPELPGSSSTTIEKNAITFPVLIDRDLNLARQFGLVFQLPENIEGLTRDVFGLDLTTINGTEKFELPIPASYVIDTTRTVRYAFVDANFMNRAEPQEIIDVLKNTN